MSKETKKILKNLDKKEIKELLEKASLSELEYWVLYYSLVENRMVQNTCAKLSISQAYYFIIQKLALLKVNYILKKI